MGITKRVTFSTEYIKMKLGAVSCRSICSSDLFGLFHHFPEENMKHFSVQKENSAKLPKMNRG